MDFYRREGKARYEKITCVFHGYFRSKKYNTPETGHSILPLYRINISV